jgi:hypothetical protein
MMAFYEQVMMTRSSRRSLFDAESGDRLATIMGYLSDVPAGRSGQSCSQE